MAGEELMFRERENRMMPTTGSDILMYVVAGIVGFLALLTGLAVLTNRVACESWAAPSSVMDPLMFITSQDTGAFGVTDNGCSAPTSWVFTVWAVFLVITVLVVGAGFAAYTKYRQSDGYFIKQLRRREGLAKRAEIAQWMGPKAARAATGKVRPTLKKRERKPAAGNILLGHSEGVPCWASLEESTVLIGPPRSGKGVNILVGAIIDAPGPVITTSSRADNYSMTAPLRAKKGPVTLFDPQGLTGKATTLKWSPITGCENPQVANQRATSLIGAAGLAADGNNAEWRAPAIKIMQSLLHAAALGDPETGKPATVDELMAWGNSAPAAKTAMRYLYKHEEAGRGTPGWAAALEAVIEGNEKMQANQWFGVSNAVQGLSVASVRETLNPRSVEETFDIDRFIKESGTLYIVGTKTGGASAGPFLIAMMDAITERAREIAAKRKGNRLDPPLSLVLDEIANITKAWEGLVQLMADGGGVGISAMPVFQSLAQVRDAWGEQAASAVFDAATIKIQLGGASNTTDLKVIQELAGQREVIRSSRSRQKEGSSVSDQIHDRNVLEIDELRRLPFSWAIVLFRKQRPIFMALKPYWKRKDRKAIDQAKKAYSTSTETPGQEHVWKQLVTGQADRTDRTTTNEEAGQAHHYQAGTVSGHSPEPQEAQTLWGWLKGSRRSATAEAETSDASTSAVVTGEHSDHRAADRFPKPATATVRPVTEDGHDRTGEHHSDRSTVRTSDRSGDRDDVTLF